MSNDQKNDIIQRLKTLQDEQTRLQREQDQLIDQLRNLHITTEEHTQTQNEEEEDPNVFKLGEKVHILNPGRFQERRGTICNLGDQRVTILTKRGKKIVRAPFNVQKDRQT